MSIEQAIEILMYHNLWRRGSDIPMQPPAEIGEAIDIAIKELSENIQKNKTLCQQ